MSLSACRHAMRQRSGVLLRRSSNAAAAAKPTTSLVAGFSGAPPARGLHRTAARWQQGAAAGQGEEEGWTGGDGSDGHAGARILGIVFFSSLVGATACLGTWQAMRYSWKVDMIDSRRARMATEPVDLPEGLEGAALASTMDAMDMEADGKGAKGASGQALGGSSEEGKRLLESLEGRRVTVTGVFDHSKEVLVGPRGAPPGMKATSGPSSMAPSPMGDFVHTPLKRRDGSVVLVNRGWVPRSKGTGWSRPEGEITMVGVLKAAEKRSTFSPDNKPETRQLIWAEKASLLQAAGLVFNDGAPEAGANSVPILLEAVGEEDDNTKTTPIAKKPRHFGDFYVMPQTHLMYSATWYALAAAGCALTYARFRRRGPAATMKPRPPTTQL